MLNRAGFLGHVETALAESAASSSAILVVRIARRREIDARYGYRIADKIAAAMQTRIAEVLRPIDRVHALGDGGFGVILPNLLSANHAVLAAARVARAFESPVSIDERSFDILIVSGIATFSAGGQTADLLCRHAEMACIQARRSNESFCVFEQANVDEQASDADLREALAQNQLEVYMQPVFDVRAQRIAGAESLARWTLNGQRIAPDLFIAIAEESGLISALTRWSLHASLRNAAAWRQAGHDLIVAINLSAHVLGERGLVEQIGDALSIWQVPSQALVLEITETAIMEDPQLSQRVLGQLRDLGIAVAIDDFGVGYSSFAYLRSLPATELKIDRSFTAAILADVRTAQMTRSMIDLAHHLQMKVVAEGVEDQATLDALTDMRCDMVQGYHIGRPEPAAAFAARLATATATPVDSSTQSSL